jgi:hypothetical protein
MIIVSYHWYFSDWVAEISVIYAHVFAILLCLLNIVKMQKMTAILVIFWIHWMTFVAATRQNRIDHENRESRQEKRQIEWANTKTVDMKVAITAALLIEIVYWIGEEAKVTPVENPFGNWSTWNTPVHAHFLQPKATIDRVVK